MAGSTVESYLPEQRHGAGTTALVVGIAAFLGLWAAWLLADLLPRPAGFLLGAVVGGALLYRRADRVDVVAGGLYGVALLLLSTPFVMQLPYALNAGMISNGGALTFVRTMDLVFLLLFVVLAAIPAGIAYYLTNRAAIHARAAGAKQRVLG
jgi:drug/metabolite transporter (DMT)-like permease